MFKWNGGDAVDLGLGGGSLIIMCIYLCIGNGPPEELLTERECDEDA